MHFYVQLQPLTPRAGETPARSSAHSEELHEKLLRHDLAVLDFVSADLLELDAAASLHRDIHCQCEGNGVAGDQRRGSAAAMYFLHHRSELVTLLDDGVQPFSLLREVSRRLRLDTDGVIGEELLLRGLKLPLPA